MSQPYEIFGSENLKDDDAAVIDSFFIETDSPPNLKDVHSPIIVKVLEDPKVTTRLFSREINFDPTWSTTLVLPADNNRKSLYLRVQSPTAVATDGIRFSDENGNILTGGKVLHGFDAPFVSHTGAIYGIACGNGTNGAASATVSLSIWAVTL